MTDSDLIERLRAALRGQDEGEHNGIELLARRLGRSL